MEKYNIINESIKPVDPTIVKKPNTLKPEIIKMMNTRLGDEYTAHFFYRCAANWCLNLNYKKAAKFFESEASAELDHAKKLQKYLIDWNAFPVIPSFPTDHKFANLADIIVKAYDLEYTLLQSYLENSKVIFNIDLATFDFLQDYRDYQVAEVAEYSDLLNALQLINPENNFELLYFENEYFED